jgi:hypothetical protein
MQRGRQHTPRQQCSARGAHRADDRRVEELAERRADEQQLEPRRQQREDDCAKEHLRAARAALEDARQAARAALEVERHVEVEHVRKRVVRDAPRDRLCAWTASCVAAQSRMVRIARTYAVPYDARGMQ